MIRVGFIGAVSQEWMGGLNYYKNLLFSLNTLEDKKLEIFVFVGKKTDTKIKTMFGLYAKVIEDSLFDTGSVKWYFAKIGQYVFKSNILYAKFFKRQGIQILSHTSLTNIGGIKTINWIPDFQHLHLPQMFSQQEIYYRNKKFKQLIQDSDSVVLSSYDALKDFKYFSSEFEYKTTVLQFVSQPDEKYFDLAESDRVAVLNKYHLPLDFFYLPNQFWKHKNHLFVFRAIHDLKKKGIEHCIVCSGYLNDYRNKGYIDEIRKFIADNNLQDNIKLLGVIDYKDVFSLIKFSKAVINPSLFEGWSSTVEECKSVHKNMILSDLDVHVEQYPTAQFFNRDKMYSLVDVLGNDVVKNDCVGQDDLILRTQKFAQTYEHICLELMKKCS